MLSLIMIGWLVALGIPVEVHPTTLEPRVSSIELRLHAPWLTVPTAVSVSARRTGTAKSDDLAEPDSPIIVECTAPGTLRIDLEPGSWRLETTATDGWTPVIDLEIEAGTLQDLGIELLPAGDVAAAISVDAPGTTLPQALIARWSFRGEAPSSFSPGPYEQRCLVDRETRELLCTLPARAIDLKLEAPGFVPHYAWGVEVAARRLTRLPNLVLRTGSSLIGRVERDDGAPAEGATVHITPARADRASSPTAARRSEHLQEETSVNAFGFFQISGLPPGAYAVTATLADYGRVVKPLNKVPAKTEVVLDRPLVLSLFPRAEVAVTPLTDPSGAQWTVVLADPHGATKHTQSDSTGLATFLLLEPGAYTVMVMTADGASHARREATFSPDQPRVDIAIDSVEVKGIVTLADQPLAARLYFGGSNGAESVRLRSDADGRFAGVLPRLGDWSVDVVARAEWVERKGVPIVVEPAEKGPAQIEIALPAAAIEGRVIDAGGEGVADATVVAVALGVAVSPPSPRSDDDGHFTFRGVDPGRYRLQAFKFDTRGRATSASVDIEIDAPESIAEVELVLGDRSKQRGQVLDPYGRGIPGAAVEAKLPPGASVILPRTATDADGSFALHLPPEQREAEIIVMAPGYRLHEERLRVAPDRDWVLVLDENAGVIRVTDDQSSPGTATTIERISPNPRSYPLHFLRRWAMIHRAVPVDLNTLLVPGMPSGTYQICRPPHARRTAVCVTASLSAGSEATLTMPGVASGEPRKENE